MAIAFSSRRTLIAAVALLPLTLAPALATDLDQARSAGVLGERPDGLVGTVVSPVNADIKMLVDTVNRERLAAYREVAAKNGIPLDAVQKVAGEKQIAKARTQGWYYMEPSGSWRKD